MRRRRHAGPVVLLAAVLVLLAGGCGGPPGVPTVRIELPAAEVSVDPGAAVELVGGAAHPDAADVELTWDLGDGTTAEGANPPPHRYAEPGTYVITLAGRTGEALAVPATRVVQVGAPADVGRNLAMSFGGTGRDDIDRVKIPMRDADDWATGANVGDTDATIELWLRARPGDNPAPAVECGANHSWIYGNIVLDRDRFNQGRKYGLSLAGGRLVFGVTGADDDDPWTVCGSTQVDDDRWHHVAVTRSVTTGAIQLYVDGRPDGTDGAGPTGEISYPAAAQPEAACDGGQPCTRSDPFLVLGAEKHDAGPEYPSFRGSIDELRLSTELRYAGPFAPPARGFDPDPATAALYHFDEGGGQVVRDAAGAPASTSDGIVRFGGDPVAPTWVDSEAPTGR